MCVCGEGGGGWVGGGGTGGPDSLENHKLLYVSLKYRHGAPFPFSGPIASRGRYVRSDDKKAP